MWKNTKVLVTGGTGFIGSFVVEELVKNGALVKAVTTPNSSLKNLEKVLESIEILKGDLINKKFTKNIASDIDVVFHLASLKKNIKFQKENPASILKENTEMTINLLDSVKENRVKKFVLVSSGIISLYPDLNFGDSSLGYGWSKKISEVLCTAYSKECEFDLFIARPQNTFGPRDNFKEETAQIIPAFVKRAVREESPFVIWGDGSQIKTFVYVKDVAEFLLKLVESDCGGEFVDFASKETITVRDLAELVLNEVGGESKLEFDKTKPSGKTQVKFDFKTSCDDFSFDPKTSLKEGLRKTIDWHRNNA